MSVFTVDQKNRSGQLARRREPMAGRGGDGPRAAFAEAATMPPVLPVELAGPAGHARRPGPPTASPASASSRPTSRITGLVERQLLRHRCLADDGP
jgi:hypothetical protein